jgi:hypothetical protein
MNPRHRGDQVVLTFCQMIFIPSLEWDKNNVAQNQGSLVAFKDRTALKKYMHLKPIKRGSKVWAMACANTGYLI